MAGLSMTPEEIGEEFSKQNHAALLAAGEVSNENILALLNQASTRGFAFGVNLATSELMGALTVRKAAA